MVKLCEFLQDVKEDDKIIWNKGSTYTVTYETNDAYFFGVPIENGISKTFEGKLFKIIEKDDIK